LQEYIVPRHIGPSETTSIHVIASGTQNNLAKVLWRKILAREYEVEPAILYKIAKDSGGHREIMVFSIPDAAIANLFNRKLRDRNKNILSSFCYSYRNDRGLFDAVLQLSSLLRGEKVYVVQFDFSKYFDSIKHDYINFILDRNFFVISPTEKFIIGKFLAHRFAELPQYRKGEFKNGPSERPRAVRCRYSYRTSQRMNWIRSSNESTERSSALQTTSFA
jgi:hypothetical protein